MSRDHGHVGLDPSYAHASSFDAILKRERTLELFQAQMNESLVALVVI